MYKSETGKFKALIADVKAFREKGQPVLIGTASIQKNDLLGLLLEQEGIPHEVLNAKNNEREAAIVAKAGQKGAITLATNIAGRGTDIVLGEGVKELGGLVVLGSERHESRRIDNQLRGRCGRQGDPGMTQFYVSAEDDLLRIFQGDRIKMIMNRLKIDEDTPIENRAFSRTLESAQKKVEGFNFDIRKNVVQYDNVMNRHRRAIYSIRQRILKAENARELVLQIIGDEVKALTDLSPRFNKEFTERFTSVIPLSESIMKKIVDATDKQRYGIAVKAAEKLYAEREKELSEDIMRRIEREAYLTILDQLWMRHLEDMDHLREGIGLRGYGQKDPLVEYRSEAQRLFEQFEAIMREEIVRAIYHVRREDLIPENAFDTDLTRAAANSVETGVNEVGQASEHAGFEKDESKKAVAKKPVKNVAKVARQKKKQQRQNRKKH
jgi:preprotein translocase subunit SecA